MGFIKDINELEKSVKYFIISIICIIPFWYVSVWWFNPYLFHSESAYLIFSLCFCLTLGLYLLNLLLEYLLIAMFNIEKNNIPIYNELHLVSALDTLIYFSIAILYCYFSKIKYDFVHIHYSFSKLIIAVFCFTLFRILWMLVILIINIVKHLNNNKNTN